MSEDLQSIKIILLGDPGVGKACLIEKYKGNVLGINKDSIIGANYSVKIIKKGNKKYILDIWDTAGQEKFHSLGKHFYKDSYIVCFVNDITSQDSLDSLKSTWYPDLLEYGEKYTVLAVVGNKADLYECENLADEREAKQFAKEIDAIFMLTSAKTGDGIDKLFDSLTDKYLSPEFHSKIQEMLKGNESFKFIIKNDKKKTKIKRVCVS